jgi:hypothetical protein
MPGDWVQEHRCTVIFHGKHYSGLALLSFNSIEGLAIEEPAPAAESISHLRCRRLLAALLRVFPSLTLSAWDRRKNLGNTKLNVWALGLGRQQKRRI